MNQKLKDIIENYQHILKINEQNFSGESIFDKNLNSSSFTKLSLDNCTFHKINFGGSSFWKCEFKECTFTHTRFKKTEFESCIFKNCTIIDSNLDKIDFDETSFNRCQFKKISLVAGSFNCCEFIESDFEDISSYASVPVDSKFYKFNRCIDLKGDFSFEHILKVLKSIPPT